MATISRTRRTVTVAMAGGAVMAGLFLPGHTVAAAAPPSPGFGQPTVSGIQGNGFEQDLRLDNTNGYIYTSAPQSLSSTVSDIWRSADGGLTFKEIPASVQPAGKPLTCAGGGDSELDVDSAGHLYFADLTLLNISAARSDDHGTTFGPNTTCTALTDVSTTGCGRRRWAIQPAEGPSRWPTTAWHRATRWPAPAAASPQPAATSW